MKICTVLVAGTLALAAAQGAQAQNAGDWILRLGVHSIQAKSDNHSLVDVDDSVGLTFSGTYLFAAHWGVEVLAALPFSHDIDLNAGGRVAEVKHLPPTVSLQYHFNPTGGIRPYVGAGLNYTLFFDEQTSGALQGADLELDPSFGVALQAGVDVDFARDWFISAEARWLDIDTDAKVDGASIGTVEIDPYVFGVSIGRRF